MGVVIRFPDEREKKRGGNPAASGPEERFQYPGPEPVAEVSCHDHREHTRGKGGPEEDTRAAR